MRLVAATEPVDADRVSIRVPPLHVPIAHRTPRLLCFDIENGPDWYGGGDFVYDRIFCVSYKWVGGMGVATIWIDWEQNDDQIRAKLAPFVKAVAMADVFLGHNFGHDWKGIGGLFREVQAANLPKRPDRPVVDTMRCIPAGIPRSLDDLCKRFGLGDKPHLANRDWTLALRRGDREKVDLVKHRNRADVLLTEALYWKEREIGWLP